MPLAIAFWILMLLWLVLGLYGNRQAFTAGNFAPVGGNLLLFLIIAILGWQVFGSAIHR